ncbi:hypothetical protein ACFXAS_33665 [Streptomyces sp. NPDC059459]|uniref:hypothetical protein n=1 Tax=Streptomyces sp. NPDC059459 TaxID=3346839 RepID=UPI0036ADBA4F
MVHTLAREVMVLNQQVAELDKAIEARFREHRDFSPQLSRGEARYLAPVHRKQDSCRPFTEAESLVPW